MVQPVRQRFDFPDYVRVEQDSSIKHEFLGGHVWAMAGGSPEHSRIATNIARALGNQLEGRPCTVFNSDLRIRVKASGLATYPDVTVVCGPLELDPEDQTHHTVTNPKLLVEVLSPSTADYDRGEKLDHYKQVDSLETIVLIAHDEQRADVWHRSGPTWVHAIVTAHGTLELDAVGARLALDDAYRDPLAS